MNLITNPDKSQWTELLKRPVMNTENLFDTVRSIIDRVKAEGDRAVLEYEEKFDKVALTALAVTEEEQAEAETLVGEELKKAIRLAKQNIETFHAAQRFEGKRGNSTGSYLLAEGGCHRESRIVHSRRNGSAFFYRVDAGCSGKDCRM